VRLTRSEVRQNFVRGSAAGRNETLGEFRCYEGVEGKSEESSLDFGDWGMAA
jgi:hypothetical protein